ncbi:LysM peptidoglycan-binding domain-containing protein, partial [Virgibacillus salexigens]|uniref:LysM peptidoglycan-binding domain-containing protein n=1 Tax=Virgibacillus salexigens TaxID=61016 RepID=UPI00190B08AC
SGDNLWAIAQRYQISVSELASFNNITDPSLLFVGQMLQVPFLTYVIQPGDSLWAIANRFGGSVDDIVRENEIVDPSLIYSGQRIRISQPARPTTEINAYS